MKTTKLLSTVLATLTVVSLAGCWNRSTSSPDVAEAIHKSLDQGIEKNLDAALNQSKLHESVNYKVKNGEVTLSGQVDSEDARKGAESLATAVPNVQQVVNDLQIKSMKASSGQ